MEYILLCRAFFLIPFWVILLFSTVGLVIRWIRNKKISRKSMVTTFTVMIAAMLCTYFLFVHGNLRKTTVNLNDCINSFDSILSLDKEKQDTPYWGSEDGEYYYTSRCIDNVQLEFHIVYGKMRPDFDVTATASNMYESMLAPLFSSEKKTDDIACTASAMYAGKEERFGVDAFNGCYSGTILMCKDDINIVIDYHILNEPKLFYAFTTEKPQIA